VEAQWRCTSSGLGDVGSAAFTTAPATVIGINITVMEKV
jgi:hypothetical protein